MGEIGFPVQGDDEDALVQAIVREAHDADERVGGILGGAAGQPPEDIFTTDFDGGGGGDLDALVRFLGDVERLLEFVSEQPEGLVPAELHDRVRRAWGSVQPRFKPAVQALVEVPHSALESAGVAGPELAMKIAGLNIAYRNLQRAVARAARAVPVPRAARLVPKALAAVLGMADVIADSLPVIGQLMHPILEHKGFVERAADAVDVSIDVADMEA
jgi:hypothetical protein